MRRVARVAAATAMVLATLVYAYPSGARAQTTPTSAAGPTPLPVGISLVSQSTWVPLREAFTMRLHIDNTTLAANPNAAILIQVHESATSRSGFDEAVTGRRLGGTLSVPNQIRLAALQRDSRGDVSVSFGLSGSDVRPAIGINRPGVYPVEVQLVNTGAATQSFVTWLVVVDTRSDEPIDKRLSVAFVWPAVADPIALPDGSDDPKVVAEMKPGGRLDKIATLLARSPRLAVSLVIGPETAEAWRRLGQRDRTGAVAASFARVRAAATRSTTEVLPAPYVPIDAAALEAAGLGGYLPAEYAKGTRSLRATLGTNPSTQAQSAFVEPAKTSDAAIDALGQMLIDRVALREQALIPVIHPFSPAEAFVLQTTSGGSRAVATAPFVEDLFNGSDPAALRAERVIAALAEIAYETPSIARGIVIAPPERWNPDLKTMQTVAGALRTLPLVQSATLDELFTTISNEQAPGSTVDRRLAIATPAATPVSASDYQRVADDLSAYRDVVGSRDPVVVDGEAALLTTLSTSISPERAHAELTKIEQAVHSFAGGVTADEKRITLTSRRADVPLSFENHLQPPRAVTVRVHLESPKLRFPNGADQLVPLKPGSNTVRFAVEARASGTFPMTISVTSENGKLAFGAPVRVTVRSAVFGGWAVGVTVAALVFLTGWWANHIRRSRRSRRLAASAAPSPAP
jgi:Family of unknown function (DUF6049)